MVSTTPPPEPRTNTWGMATQKETAFQRHHTSPRPTNHYAVFGRSQRCPISTPILHLCLLV